MSNKAVCRTAPATPGLSIIWGIFIRLTVKELLGLLKRLAPVMGLLPVYYK